MRYFSCFHVWYFFGGIINWNEIILFKYLSGIWCPLPKKNVVITRFTRRAGGAQVQCCSIVSSWVSSQELVELTWIQFLLTFERLSDRTLKCADIMATAFLKFSPRPTRNQNPEVDTTSRSSAVSDVTNMGQRVKKRENSRPTDFRPLAMLEVGRNGKCTATRRATYLILYHKQTTGSEYDSSTAHSDFTNLNMTFLWKTHSGHFQTSITWWALHPVQIWRIVIGTPGALLLTPRGNRVAARVPEVWHAKCFKYGKHILFTER